MDKQFFDSCAMCCPLRYKGWVVGAGKNQHVTKCTGGGWQVKGAGNSKATKVTNTQKQAIAVARKIARNQKSELVIHGMDGRIRTKNSYGHAPCPA